MKKGIVFLFAILLLIILPIVLINLNNDRYSIIEYNSLKEAKENVNFEYLTPQYFPFSLSHTAIRIHESNDNQMVEIRYFMDQSNSPLWLYIYANDKGLDFDQNVLWDEINVNGKHVYVGISENLLEIQYKWVESGVSYQLISTSIELLEIERVIDSFN